MPADLLLNTFLTTFIAAGGTFAFNWIRKNLTDSRQEEFEEVNKNISALYEKVDLMDKAAEKTHLELQLSVLRVGILDGIDRDDEISVIKQYTDYQKLHGNSYIHDKVHEYLCSKGHEEYCKGEKQ